MRSLNVFYEDQRVGQLTRDDDLVYGFAYDDNWQVKGFPLSIAMPLAKKSFGNKITLSFFENLLPEGEVKENLQRAHGITGLLDFLGNYGKDCAGAIIVTDQADYKHSIELSKSVPIDMDKVYAAIEEKNSVADVVAHMNPGYLSLAGAQDKFPAIYKNGQFLLPTEGAPTTHIVKAPIQHSGIKESIVNGYYCMELARAIGMTVPKCFIVEGTSPLFVIERYDRTVDNKGVRRIHQQDFCQAQGVTSEFKYEDKGGPTLKDNYELIQANVPANKKIESIEKYLDWIAFNLIIGNNDSHSKNISFLLLNERNELAPFYDLICTAIYPKLKRQFSFKIGDRDDFSKVGSSQIQLLEKSLGLKEGVFSTRLRGIVRLINVHKDAIVKKMDSKYKIPKRISALIEERIRSLILQGVSL